ncbi:hypothetical protein [Anaerotignum sp. MB30-C6]|uniref:hypothetical protein n=1 Tax=Anaerotignum sp. MB30-C6 TaxID=3070814 RepID=UPI0027DD3AB5|nr:hypothetical protein [Anaerotignum sp. MB30-C6]WMI81905.1 hypothetical protein RBQ60_04020 [Anaerotignum sp. MB30-C6]
MGCDIHVFVEHKLWYGERKGEWFSCDHYRKNTYFGTDECEPEFEVIEIYGGRNYTLFSILADVRNYGDNEPISMPKGLPSDCCKDILDESNRWGCDGHSHSYFTLKELMDWKESHPIATHQGYVSAQAANELDRDGKIPDCSWQDGNIKGQTWRKWSKPNTSLDGLISALKERTREIFYIYDDNDPRIAERSEDIRIVFWFDN